MEHVLLDVKTNWEINHPKRRGILEHKKKAFDCCTSSDMEGQNTTFRGTYL